MARKKVEKEEKVEKKVESSEIEIKSESNVYRENPKDG